MLLAFASHALLSSFVVCLFSSVPDSFGNDALLMGLSFASKISKILRQVLLFFFLGFHLDVLFGFFFVFALFLFLGIF